MARNSLEEVSAQVERISGHDTRWNLILTVTAKREARVNPLSKSQG
jgi:hypothetical protein